LGAVSRETPVLGLATEIPDSGPGVWFGRSGGPWVYPDQWNGEELVREAGVKSGPELPEKVGQVSAAVQAGFAAARRLADLMARAENGGVQLARYLAVIVQDVDSMGMFLSGQAADRGATCIRVDPEEHGRVSGDLARVAGEQRDALAVGGLLGVPVYAGGDDLLAFSPASTALAAARACNAMIPQTLPSASTAVVFFHYHASIQLAMRNAHDLLKDAKNSVPGKHALAVRYLRRSGTSATSVQPWPGRGEGSSADLFGIFARAHAAALSPRLVADLERDAVELSSLAGVSERLYLAELKRLVRRHSAEDREVNSEAAAEAATALDWLGRHECADDPLPGPHLAAKVGVFLRQEAR
jgi:CRISPR-associated protein Cmr2